MFGVGRPRVRETCQGLSQLSNQWCHRCLDDQSRIATRMWYDDRGGENLQGCCRETLGTAGKDKKINDVGWENNRHTIMRK